MAGYKEFDYSQGKFIPIHFDRQILIGTFGDSLPIFDPAEEALFKKVIFLQARYMPDDKHNGVNGLVSTVDYERTPLTQASLQKEVILCPTSFSRST